jgi:hypothetical protein
MQTGSDNGEKITRFSAKTQCGGAGKWGLYVAQAGRLSPDAAEVRGCCRNFADLRRQRGFSHTLATTLRKSL